MKRKTLLFVITFFVVNSWASDFIIDGIAYNILSAETPYVAEITSGGTYNGNITIPSTIQYNNITYNITSIGISAFYNCAGLTSITIPNSITTIKDRAFLGCEGLKSIEMPNSILSIGDNAFYRCTSLTLIDIPNSVNTIGVAAFAYCSQLASIIVENNNSNYMSIDGVLFSKDTTALIQYPAGNTTSAYITPSTTTSINDYAFYMCNNLNSITIANSVKSIGKNVFYNCTNLKSIILPNSITKLGYYAFGECTNLSSIQLSDAINTIESRTFWGCTKLNSISIPNSVTSIGFKAFNNCTSLISIELPNSITSIGEEALYGCINLKTINSKITNPENVNLGDNVFYDVPKSTCNLSVPNGAKNSYQNIQQWKDFLNIVEEYTATKHVTASELGIKTNNGKITFKNLQGQEIIEIYNLQGQKFFSNIANSNSYTIEFPKKGIYIIRVGLKSTKVILH